MKIIFIGTPEFGAIVLEGLIGSGYKPVLVITAPDKPIGRKQVITPPPVKITAQKYNIPVEQPSEIKNLKFKIKNLQPDLAVVAAYGQILPKEILDIPKYGCLNVHASLLPKYRGPSPIPAAILNNDKKTGVTIILMDEKIDHGPIVAQRSLEIEEKETAGTLHDKLAELGAHLLLEIITKWVKKMIKPQEQDHSRATFTGLLTRGDGEINWKKSAETLEREIRAFHPWPGSYTTWEHRGVLKKIKILQARTFQSPDGIHYPVGKVLIVPQNEIGVQCGKVFSKEGGDFLAIEKLQMEGKNEMGAEDFVRGCPGFVGAILR